MSETISQLRSISDEELIRLHDYKAQSTEVGTNHYLTELHRRDQNRATDAMLRYTKQLTWMTIVITIATIINTILVGITLFR